MLVEVTCENYNCPGHEKSSAGQIVTDYKYLANSYPDSHTDPGYIEGSCDHCGEDAGSDFEPLSEYDLDCMRYNL